MTLVKCLITSYFYAILLTHCIGIKSDEKNNEEIESPSDIASVSKFIKEFHRKLEEDLYPIVDYDTSNDSDMNPPYINDNVTNSANKSGSSEKNVTSLVNCNTERKPGGLTVECWITSGILSVVACIFILFLTRFGFSSIVRANVIAFTMDENPKPVRNKKNMHATTVKVPDVIQHCGPIHIFNSILVNSSRLVQLLMPDPNITHRLMEAECVVLLFYSRTCPFSCLAAPHFNALPRAFPSIKMAAVNAMMYQSFNTQYGVAGVPTVMLFHNGKAVAKFNDSEYTLKMFARFIVRFTGLKPVEKMFVTSGDFGGPVPSRLTRERDYMLGLAWIVIILALGVGVSKSTGWRAIVETIQATWREAQAHHDHND